MLDRYNYLVNERKLTPEIIELFQIKCIKSDMSYFREQLDDRFNNAVLIPIFDLYGNPLSVNARRFNIKPKYMHLSYEKSKNLFGLNFTYKDIIDKDEAIVVEGCFDLMQLYQNGIKNVVSVMGSAFTMRQLCLLLRFTSKICMIPDGDLAGEKSKKRIIKMLKGSGIELRFVDLPRGYDPDTFMQTFGRDRFIEMLEEKSLFKGKDLN